MTDYRMVLTETELVLTGRDGHIYTVTVTRGTSNPIQTAINTMLMWIERKRPDIAKNIDASPGEYPPVPVIMSESNARTISHTPEMSHYMMCSGDALSPNGHNRNYRYGIREYLYGLPVVVMPDREYPAFVRALMMDITPDMERMWDAAFGHIPHWGPRAAPPRPWPVGSQRYTYNPDDIPPMVNPTPMPRVNRYIGTPYVPGPNGERIPLTDARGHADKPPVVGFVENIRTDAAGNVVCDVFLVPPVADAPPPVRFASILHYEPDVTPDMVWRFNTSVTELFNFRKPVDAPKPVDDCDAPSIIVEDKPQ